MAMVRPAKCHYTEEFQAAAEQDLVAGANVFAVHTLRAVAHREWLRLLINLELECLLRIKY